MNEPPTLPSDSQTTDNPSSHETAGQPAMDPMPRNPIQSVSFPNMPVEIVTEIAEYLSRGDKCRFIRTCRTACSIQPLLYRNIVATHFTRERVTNLLETWTSREDLAASVRVLAVYSLFHGALGPIKSIEESSPQDQLEIERNLETLFSSSKLLKNVESLDLTEQDPYRGPRTTAALEQDPRWWAFWEILAAMPLKHRGLHLKGVGSDLRAYTGRFPQLSSLDLRQTWWGTLPSPSDLSNLRTLRCDLRMTRSLVPGLSITALALDRPFAADNEANWASMAQTVRPIERPLVHFSRELFLDIDGALRRIGR